MDVRSRLGFEAIPWSTDRWLREADRLLGLSTEPALAAADWMTARPWVIEPLAFFYAAFILYLYLTIFLSLLGRPAPARQVFLLVFALIYVPLVALIAVVTLALRYHHAIDLVAGAAPAVLALEVAGRWQGAAGRVGGTVAPVTGATGRVAAVSESLPTGIHTKEAEVG